MRLISTTLVLAGMLTATTEMVAQRPASPRGEASTQFGGEYAGRSYVNGKWIVVDYGRPILRGRVGVFGEGENYGQSANAGAPVWRAGANQSTRFMTEADLQFGDAVLPAGEYSLFVDLKEDGWTLIFSSHEAQEQYEEGAPGLWGAYGYSEAKDVLRIAMNVEAVTMSVDQFTINFVNMSKLGGALAMMWETTMAWVNFTLAE